MPINHQLKSSTSPVEAGREPSSLLAINGGSSSIRFALYEEGEPLRQRLVGKVDRIGLSGMSLTFEGSAGTPPDRRTIKADDHHSAVVFLLDWLETQQMFATVIAVGHRVVHGMTHSEPERVTPELLDELRRITPYDPEHLPLEIELIEAFRQRHPALPQVACFDTAFHRIMPRVASLLAIPRRYEAAGVRRYGFHGLSYEFLMEELARLGDPAATKGRVILAHLGNGASMAAVCDGKSIDTSMGFTPTAGLVMSSRSGDLDPGLVSYLARTEQMSATQFQKMVNHESGLLGVSETSSDLRDLLEDEKEDFRAAEAVALFCYQAKKWIGAYAAALGGLDTLVFAGGIGENAPLVRARICEGLGFLGIDLDVSRNAVHAGVISLPGSGVVVRVIPTDEELMIARSVSRVLGLQTPFQGNPTSMNTKKTTKTSPRNNTPLSNPNHPMLRSIKQLYWLSLGTAEGEIGQIKDFYFDDEHWAVRYVVADTGSWLAGRLVLISPHAIGNLCEDGETLRVNLTREQIEKSPAMASHKPVSRQFEEEYYRYYGWSTYWGGSEMWGTGGFPMAPLPSFPLPEEPSTADSESHQGDDPHLRSTKALSGYHIETPEGAIGHVTDFMIDDKSWAIRHLVVETGHWYAGKEIVLSPGHVKRISYDESKVFVDLTKDAIRDAPEFLMP